MNRLYLPLAVLTLLIAAALRFHNLNDIPPGLHFDRAADTIIAQEIAFNGYRPIFIADYTGKEPLFFYCTALLMQLVGPGKWTMQLSSAFFGLLSVAGGAFAVRRFFARDPRRDALALLILALSGAAFWHIVLSRMGFRAIAQPFFQVMTLGLLWLSLRSQHRNLLWAALAGLCAGLAAYTYMAVRLFPILLAAVLITWLIASPQRGKVAAVGAIFGVSALVIVLPLLWYFTQNPQAFSTRIDQVAPRTLAEAWEGWRLALGMLFISGDPLWRFNLPGKPLFNPVEGLLMLTGLGLSVWGALARGRSPAERTRDVLLCLWIPAMLAPTALATGGITPSNLRAVGLAPLIALYPALGLLFVLKQAAHWLPQLIIGAALITGGLAAYDLNRWAASPQLYYEEDGHVAALAHYLNTLPQGTTLYAATLHYGHPTLNAIARHPERIAPIFGAGTLVLPSQGRTLIAFTYDVSPPADWDAWLAPHLLAAPLGPGGSADFQAYQLSQADLPAPDLPQQTDFSGVIRLQGASYGPAAAGGTLPLDLHWQVTGPPPAEDYAFTAQLCDAQGWCWVRANFDGSIERGVNSGYPSVEWKPGDHLLTRVNIPLSEGMPPGLYTARISVFSAAQNSPLLADQGSIYAQIGPVEVLPQPAPQPDLLPMQQAGPLTARPGLLLYGWDVPPQQTMRQGQRFSVALHWLVQAAQPADFSIRFSLGEDTSLLEAVPLAGAGYGPARWGAGEFLTDRYLSLRVPDDLPPGDYPLLLHVEGGQAMTLGRINVEAAQRLRQPPPGLAPVEGVVYGQAISLAGYTLNLEADQVIFQPTWKAISDDLPAYTVFLHLVNAEGQLLAQVDRPPMTAGSPYPTDQWARGEYILDDPYVLNLPAGADVACCTVRLGLYDPLSGPRLPLPTGEDAFSLALGRPR